MATCVLLASAAAYVHAAEPPLPRYGQILWLDNCTSEKLARIHAAGVDTALKIVGGGDWPAVEPEEGKFRFQPLVEAIRRCREAGLNVVPSVSINVAPDWLVQRYAGCLSEASDGARSKNHLSPWFLDAAIRGDMPEMQQARRFIQRYLDAFLAAVCKEPNVSGVFAGDWTLLFGGVWHGDHFGCWDRYALADFRRVFGQDRKPPATHTDYVRLSPEERRAFVLWQGEALTHFLQEYLRWIGDRTAWKFVDASTFTDTVGGGDPKFGVLQTATRLNYRQKIDAMVASGVQGICVDCSNLGDYGLVKQHAYDSDLARVRHLHWGGENVPEIDGGMKKAAESERAYRAFTESRAEYFILLGDSDNSEAKKWIGRFLSDRER